jgi:hypothetical protein
MGDLDMAFRRLVRELPQPFLSLAFPEHHLEPGGPIDPSLDRDTQRTADNMFFARDAQGDVVVHVEFEREWRAKIPGRMFEYASRAVGSKPWPVWSAVVLLRPGGGPPDSPADFRLRGPDDDAFVYRYRVVPLWQLDARQKLAEIGLTCSPFCLAMRGADEAFLITVAERLVADRSLTDADREHTFELLFSVTSAIFGDDIAWRVFHMESIIQDPNVQRFFKRLKEEGAREGTRAHLFKLLAKRFFEVTPNVRARIDGEADVARLESWVEAAVSAATIDDVFRNR